MKQLSRRIKIFIALFVFCSLSVKGQSIYLTSGLNLTDYSFEGTDDLPLSFNRKVSSFYELGTAFKLKDPRWIWRLGLAFNGFNSTGGDSGNHYEWQTTFFGLNNHLMYAIISSEKSPLELSAGFQFQMMHIINGEQKINGQQFDLFNETEFKGFWVQPGFVLSARYFVTKEFQLSLSYNYSTAANLSNNTQEKFTFNNQQVRFGLHVNLTK